MKVHSLQELTGEQRERLAQRKIYFGHQSVGKNILAGVEDILKGQPDLKLRIVESLDGAALGSPVFAHAPLGRNRDPAGKIRAFSAALDNGVGGRADIAFMKLCFLDIVAQTDVAVLFEEYRRAADSLRQRYPTTTLVHFTVPVTTSRRTRIMSLKELLGKRQERYYADNVRRNEFNDLMRREYEGVAPLFDLARVEATHPDGRRASFRAQGQAYDHLVAEYSRDGGHLNERGRKFVAEQLLFFLATVN